MEYLKLAISYEHPLHRKAYRKPKLPLPQSINILNLHSFSKKQNMKTKLTAKLV